jgi:hypothetical protein
MTENEYELAKAEIVRTFGKPEWDMKDPSNESARKLRELEVSFRHAKRAEKKLESERKKMLSFQSEVEGKDNNGLVPMSLPPSMDPYFSTFSSEEQRIILEYMKNPYQEAGDIAKKLYISHQKVGAFLRADKFTKFYSQAIFAMQEQFPALAVHALIQCAHSKNESVKLRAAELLAEMSMGKGSKKDEKRDIVAPDVQAALRELGDKLAIRPKQ